VAVRRVTDKALLVDHGRKEEAWVPKSQISDFTGPDLDHADSIFLPEWLAAEKGMV
jgi:hypothetical protein